MPHERGANRSGLPDRGTGVVSGGGNRAVPVDRLDPAPSENWIVYDGDCPMCSRLTRWQAVRAGLPGVRLISARDTTAPEVAWLRAQGVRLNDAMALHDGETLFTGSAAVERLLRLETAGRLRWLAPLLRPGVPGDQVYALLKLGRAAGLFLLGRRGMDY